MTKTVKRIIGIGVMGLMGAMLAIALAYSTPHVDFLDLASGPNTGGEHGLGVYVTVYGERFGATRGMSQVTIGGGEVATYVSWNDTQIVVELGSSVQSGAVIVSTMLSSNVDVTFTVRAGGIYFVSPGGNNSTGNGSFSAPWLDLKKCKTMMVAGDTCYAMNNYLLNGADAYNFTLSISKTGTQSMPMAIVAYPGAVATIDGSSQLNTIGTPILNSAPFEYWTIAKMNIIGAVGIKVTGRGWRIIGNKLTCPTGNGGAACMEGSKASDSEFRGNEVYNAGCGEAGVPCVWKTASQTISTIGTDLTLSAFVSAFSAHDKILVGGIMRTVLSCTNTTHCTLDSPFPTDLPLGTTGWQFRDFIAIKTYHAVYYSTDSVRVYVTHNYIHDNLGCRAIQFHSSPFVTSTIVSSTDTTPIVLTFNSTHPNFVTGERLFMAGHLVNTNVNGVRFIKFTSPNTAEIYSDKLLQVPVAGNGAGAGNGGTAKDGTQQYDLYVYNNLIRNQTCDGIDFATVDPTLGPVEAKNNLIINTGLGANDGMGGFYDPPPGPASYAGIYNACITNTGPSGTGNSLYQNNTLVNIGSRGGTLAGAYNLNCAVPGVIINNQITYQANGIPYFSSGSLGYSGANNLWYSVAPPVGFTGSVVGDPMFVAIGLGNYRLQAGSPAIGIGLASGSPPYDLDGVERPIGIGVDSGAYEFVIQNFPPVAPTEAGVVVQ